MDIIEKELLIVGGGPTGLVCAIEAAKQKMDYLVLEKGLLVNSIYNFPTNMTFFSTSELLEIGDIPFISHNDKPTRKEALEYYRRIASSYAINIKFRQKVIRIEKESTKFRVETATQTYHCNYIIIATGFYDFPRLLDVPGESLEKVKHYYDDAHPYIGQKVIVVGAANSACDVALETYQKGADVTMVIKDSAIYDKVKYWIKPNIENRIKEGSIKTYFNSNIKHIHPTHVIIDSPEGEKSIPNDYVLAMTGYRPDYTFLTQIGVELDPQTKIPNFDALSLESNVENMYLAGVILAGNNTSKLFIENTRNHGEKIIKAIKQQQFSV